MHLWILLKVQVKEQFCVSKVCLLVLDIIVFLKKRILLLNLGFTWGRKWFSTFTKNPLLILYFLPVNFFVFVEGQNMLSRANSCWRKTCQFQSQLDLVNILRKNLTGKNVIFLAIFRSSVNVDIKPVDLASVFPVFVQKNENKFYNWFRNLHLFIRKQ